MADTLLRLHVTPRGSRNQITGWRGDILHIKITAPPVEGAANEAAVKFIAAALGLPKTRVEIVSGTKSREKTIRITGLSDDEVRQRLG